MQFLIAVLATASAASTLLMFRRVRASSPLGPVPPPEPAIPAAFARQAAADRPMSRSRTAEMSPGPGRDPWQHELRRCEQAVHRAWCAVDTVSSAQARAELRSVVRRMEAELPAVRALAELGRSFTVGAPSRSGNEAARRVFRQLADAATTFGEFTDQVLAAVGQLVAAPDLDRMRRQVGELRGGFPLLRPMSALLRSGPDAPRSGTLLDPVG